MAAVRMTSCSRQTTRAAPWAPPRLVVSAWGLLLRPQEAFSPARASCGGPARAARRGCCPAVLAR
eukprot:scaffold33009_cov57-Phaeocystis_antarctica.AAC.1